MISCLYGLMLLRQTFRNPILESVHHVAYMGLSMRRTLNLASASPDRIADLNVSSKRIPTVLLNREV